MSTIVLPELDRWSNTLILKYEVPENMNPRAIAMFVAPRRSLMELAVVLGAMSEYLKAGRNVRLLHEMDDFRGLMGFDTVREAYIGYLLARMSSYRIRRSDGSWDVRKSQEARSALAILGIRYGGYQRGSLYLYVYLSTTGLTLCGLGVKWLLNAWKEARETYATAGAVRKSDAEIGLIDSAIQKNLADARLAHASAMKIDVERMVIEAESVGIYPTSTNASMASDAVQLNLGGGSTCFKLESGDVDLEFINNTLEMLAGSESAEARELARYYQLLYGVSDRNVSWINKSRGDLVEAVIRNNNDLMSA